MKDVSVIIPSFNTRDITHDCLNSLIASLNNGSRRLNAEIIVVDNASSDGSVEMLHAYKKNHHIDHIHFVVICNDRNYGYSKGNNIGLERATGKYVLYLNSDVLIDHVNFADLVDMFEKQHLMGGLTVRVNLENGSIDPASHRGFPTIWRSMTYLAGLERMFAGSYWGRKYFGGYHLMHLDLDTQHEIDAATGAFFMTRKSILEKLNGFDEDFFMYGEDLDLCYRIKKLGYTILYVPEYHVTHLKYKSGLSSTSEQVRMATRKHFHEAMKLFYRKHYAPLHNSLTNAIILELIDARSKRS